MYIRNLNIDKLTDVKPCKHGNLITTILGNFSGIGLILISKGTLPDCENEEARYQGVNMRTHFERANGGQERFCDKEQGVLDCTSSQ